ncbi:MAG: glycerol-3-phosphate acyltransferase [Chloroflexi bacterium]|nr:glycerol-3-phosphate acyltransferase [Chloroflexota bacterium]
MDPVIIISSLLISYLLGSISFARLIVKLWTGKDVAEFEVAVDGTGETYKAVSIGGNTVSTVLGAKGGLTVGVLDILKVTLPTLTFKLLYPEQPVYMLIAAVGGLVGHIWPIYYRFHGGAGFSAIMGGLLVIDWLAVLATPIAGLLLGMVVFRNMIVASLSWIWLLVPWLWWRTGGDPAHLFYAVMVNVLFLLAMRPEYKIAMKYKKEGKMLEYGLGNLKSNPMGRGMLKMAKFFKVEIK